METFHVKLSLASGCCVQPAIICCLNTDTLMDKAYRHHLACDLSPSCRVHCFSNQEKRKTPPPPPPPSLLARERERERAVSLSISLTFHLLPSLLDLLLFSFSFFFQIMTQCRKTSSLHLGLNPWNSGDWWVLCNPLSHGDYFIGCLLSFVLVQKWPTRRSSPFFFSFLFDCWSGAPGVMAIRFSHQPRDRHHGLYHELQWNSFSCIFATPFRDRWSSGWATVHHRYKPWRRYLPCQHLLLYMQL